jgi:cellulose synthase/poly-beta-1,6-N-acetylglucosamine synthase-like glycosyltransferase
MIEPLNLLLLPWFLIITVSTISAWRYGWGLPRPETPSVKPIVAVIVAVKGASHETAHFFENLQAQAYPNFRVIVGVESSDDPAYALANALAQKGPIEFTSVVAGVAQSTGQKVANLLAALDQLEPRDEIIIFTDADTLPDPRWISRLVAALVDAKHLAVTGYRWMVPMDQSLSSALVAAANTSVVTMPRNPFAANLCWGGTMALRQQTLNTINIRAYWRGAISDDLQMTRALREHRIKIFSPRQSLLLSPISMDFKAALAFGCRQYRIIFTHEPLLWTFAAFCILVPIGSFFLAFWLMSQGIMGGLFILVFALACGEIRFFCRKKIALALWHDDATGVHRLPGRIDHWLRPLWWSFHALCVLSAPLSRKVHWAGKTYLIRRPQSVEILRS